MFSLRNQAAKLTNVNPRAELHGQDKKLAVDLKFEIKVSNDVLSEFDASLKGSLYKKADDGQGDLIADPKRKPAKLMKAESAVARAKSAAKATGRCEVFALVPVGIATRKQIQAVEFKERVA